MSQIMITSKGKPVTLTDSEYLEVMADQEEKLFPSNMEFKEFSKEEKAEQELKDYEEANELLLPSGIKFNIEK